VAVFPSSDRSASLHLIAAEGGIRAASGIATSPERVVATILDAIIYASAGDVKRLASSEIADRSPAW